MFTYRIAYRHFNGEVEGFKGTGTSAASAERDALGQIQNKLGSLNPPHKFDLDQVITKPEDLTDQELGQVQADWRVEERYPRTVPFVPSCPYCQRAVEEESVACPKCGRCLVYP